MTKEEVEKNIELFLKGVLESKLMARKNKRQELNKILEEAIKIDNGIAEIGWAIGNLQEAVDQMNEDLNPYLWPHGLSNVFDILDSATKEIFRAREKFNREKLDIEAELYATEMECEGLEERYKKCL